jgi:hypothetical protein
VRHPYWTLAAPLLLLTACQTPRTELPAAELSLAATVGTDPDVCAGDAQLELPAGETHTVYYCYTVTNTGDVAVPVHGLADELNGVILRDFEFALDPGASVDTVSAGVTLPVQVDATTSNTGRWDGFVDGRRLATAEAATTVTLQPPRSYGAVAGSFVGDGSTDTVTAFAGNLILIGVRELDGEPIAEPVVVEISVPGAAPFDYIFDPASTLDGVVALILDDFAPGAAASAAHSLMALGLAASVVPLERDADVQTSATLGGDFVFAFPGETLTRTVDADAALTLPVVADVTANATGDVLTVTFATDADPDVTYQVEAYGTGTNAYAGFAVGDASPIEVALSGPLDPLERVGVDVIAVRGSLEPEAVFAAPAQLDVAEYLYLSPAGLE